MAERVLLGMSGGLDSSFCAHILKQRGYEVTGAVLRMFDSFNPLPARAAALREDIPLIELDCRADFEKYVIDDFISQYSCGLTPNPCVVCNRKVKIAALCRAAKENGCGYIATGHYARIKTDVDNPYIAAAADRKKDQSYMLWRLSAEQRSMLITPLADLLKKDIRQTAGSLGIPSANAAESQDVCFLPEGNYLSFLEERAGKQKPGNFIDTDGNILGRHKGIAAYTAGQTRGLGIALGQKYSVVSINAADNTVTITPAAFSAPLYREQVKITNIVFGYTRPDNIASLPLFAKIRYAADPVPAELEPADGGYTVRFASPVRAPAPGQSCVLYTHDRDGDMCVALGGVMV